MERKRKLELDNESETENSPSKKKKKKYPIEFKLKLVEEAKKSNFLEISRKYNVSRACIRDWTKNEKELSAILKSQTMTSSSNINGNLFQLKGLKPKNKGHTNFYECCDLTKKVYLVHTHNIWKLS